MNSLLTKFKVGSTVDSGNNNVTAHLSVVVGDAPENKSFSMYTPSGEIRLHITNPNTIGFFQAGKEYLVEFREAPSQLTREKMAENLGVKIQ